MLNALFGTKKYTANFKPMFRKVADHVLSVLKKRGSLHFVHLHTVTGFDKIVPR